MKLTGDTITDEQIRELAASALVCNYCGPDDYLGMSELQTLCIAALETEARYNGRRECPAHVAYPTITVVLINPRARARCAEILNANALPGSTRWVIIADWGESLPVPAAERRAARARCADLLNERNVP